MHLTSCPRCGNPRPAFDGKTASCQRCCQVTQLSAAAPLLERANALWPDAEVTLRSKRVLSLIEQHDEWLKDRGWYDIITRTLCDNWKGEDDGYIYDPG